jgi:membrane associated rhomboid family serine protease
MNTTLPLKTQIRITLAFGALIVLISFINFLLGLSLNSFGILPRSLSHLSGIIVAPFLHANLTHLLSNLFPLLLFSWLTMQWGKATFIRVSVTIWLLSGACVWLMGREAIHIGASGIVYGYFGFLILGGFYAKKIHLTIISVAVAFIYGGMIWGVLPGRGFVSYEYHFFGLIAGLLSAKAWAR